MGQSLVHSGLGSTLRRLHRGGPSSIVNPAASPIPWAPEDKPEYFLLLPPNQQPPKTPTAFLMQAAETLRLLLADADPGEVAHVNNQLRDRLAEEFKLTLPSGLLDDPRTPGLLFFNPAPPDSNLAEWKAGIPEALKLPPMPEAELRQEAGWVSLESYLSPLL